MIKAEVFEPIEGGKQIVWFDPFSVVMVRTYIISRTIMGRYSEINVSVISFVDGKEITVEGHQVAKEIVALRTGEWKV